MTTRRLRLGVRYALGLLLLAVVLTWTDWRQLLGLVAGLSLITGTFIAIVTAFEFGSRFLSLYVLLNRWNDVPLRIVAAIDLGAKFVDQLVPSRLGGQSVRPVLIRYHTGFEWGVSTAVPAFTTGVIGVLSGGVTVTGVLLYAYRIPGWLAGLLGLAGIAYLTIGGVILLLGTRHTSTVALINRLAAWTAGIPVIGPKVADHVARVPGVIETAVVTFRELAASQKAIAAVAISWAGTSAVFPGIRVFLLLGSFGQAVSMPVLLPVALVMAYSVTLLPLTPGGIGVTEGSGALVLVALGSSPEAAVAAVFVDRVFGVYLPALVGWYPMVRIDLQSVVDTLPPSNEPSIASSDDHE